MGSVDGPKGCESNHYKNQSKVSSSFGLRSHCSVNQLVRPDMPALPIRLFLVEVALAVVPIARIPLVALVDEPKLEERPSISSKVMLREALP